MTASSLIRRRSGAADLSGARYPLIAAGTLAGLAVGCWYLAFHSVAFARADVHAYTAFLSIGENHRQVAQVARAFADLGEAHVYIYLAAVPVLIALARRRWTLAVVLAVIIPAAPLSCDVLKPLLMAPRPAVGVEFIPFSVVGSWPSGHSAAATVLAMALLLASPARWRPWVAVGGTAFSLAIIYAVLVLGSHYPSDALGGLLVALIWTSLGVAAVLVADGWLGGDLAALSDDPRAGPVHVVSAIAMLAVGAVLVSAVLVSQGHGAVSFIAHHTAFDTAALGLALAAAAAPTALTLLLSGSGRVARVARSRRWQPG